MGWFDGLLGGGGDAGADDPYGGLLNKAQLSTLQDRKWAALAGALADAGMPSRLPIPIGSALGKAAAAFGGSGPEKDALEQIAIAQKVKEAQYEYGLKQKYAPILEKLLAQQLGGGAKPLPLAAPVSPAVATPVIPAPVTPTPARSVPAQVGTGEAGALSGAGGGGGWASGVPDKFIYGPNNPKPRGPYYGQPGYQDPPGLAADAGGGDEGGLLTDPNDPLSSLPPEIRQMLAARMQGGPAAGGTPATFPDDSRYTRMVAPASARTEDGVAGSSVDPLAAIEKYESGGRNIKQQVVGESGGYNPSTGTVTGPSSASGYYQMIDPTWRHAAKLAGIDPSPYPHAMDAPRDLQERAARSLFNEQGYAPWAPYNSRLAAAVGYKGGRGGGGGPGPLAVLGGGAQTAQGVAEATDTPGLPPALQGLLALVGAGRGAASNDGLPPALQGLLSLTTSSRGDDSIDSLLTNLRNSGSSAAPAVAPPGAGGDGYGGGDDGGRLPGDPPAPTGLGGVPSGMPNIPTGVPNLGTGTGLPAGMMRPPALSLTPPGVPAAGGAPYDMSNARTLAIADAMAKLAGINMPFKELLDLSFKDPAYARAIAQQQEEAKQAAGAPYKAQEQTNQAVLDQWKAVNQSYLDKQKEWAAKGLTQDANGNLVALPNADKMGLTPNAIQQAQKDLENIRTQHKLLEQGRMLDPKDPTRIIPVPGSAETAADQKRQETAATKGVEYSFEEMKSATAAEQAAIRNQARLGPLAEAAKGFETGPGEETWTYVKQVAKKAGLITGADVADREIFQQMQAGLQAAAAPKGQGAVSDYERTLFKQQIPTMATSREGMIRAIGIANALDDYDKKVAAIHRQVAKEKNGIPDAIEAQNRIAALGPPLTPDQYSALYAPGAPAATGALNPNNPYPGVTITRRP